jgi:hypothetical protein
MTDNDGASAGMSGAHFVPLSTITGLYKGSLEAYMRDTGCRDVVITMQVTMEVAWQQGKQVLCCVGGHLEFRQFRTTCRCRCRRLPTGT